MRPEFALAAMPGVPESDLGVLGLAGPNQPYKDSAMSEFHQFLIDPNMEHECGILIASFHAQSMRMFKKGP